VPEPVAERLPDLIRMARLVEDVRVDAQRRRRVRVAELPRDATRILTQSDDQDRRDVCRKVWYETPSSPARSAARSIPRAAARWVATAAVRRPAGVALEVDVFMMTSGASGSTGL